MGQTPAPIGRGFFGKIMQFYSHSEGIPRYRRWFAQGETSWGEPSAIGGDERFMPIFSRLFGDDQRNDDTAEPIMPTIAPIAVILLRQWEVRS